jgi:hypothetical protein
MEVSTDQTFVLPLGPTSRGAKTSQEDLEEMRTLAASSPMGFGIGDDERDRRCCRAARGRRSAQHRAENSRQPFRRRDRATQRVRSPKTLHKFASVHGRCTTNSIRSSISSRGKSTSRGALLPWPSGALSRHTSPLARRRPRCMATSLHHFDTASRFGQTGRIRGRDRVKRLRLPYEHLLLSKRLAPAGGQRCRR